MNNEITYRLYALPPSRMNPYKYKYTRITPSYILVYTRCQLDNAVLISDNDISRLSRADSAWLMECNVQIIADETAKHNEEIIKEANDKIVILEEALKRERASLTEGVMV